MNNDELHESIKAEIRISELNTIESVRIMFEGRISSLEHWRTGILGGAAVVGIIFAILKVFI